MTYKSSTLLPLLMWLLLSSPFTTARHPLCSQPWKTVSAGYHHVLALLPNDELMTWGPNTEGELGVATSNSGQNEAVAVLPGAKWKFVVAGYFMSFGIMANGTLRSWGNNRGGPLRNGAVKEKKVPTQIGNDTDWLLVSAKFNFALALKTDGSLYGWGRNNYGQLGNNSTKWSKVLIATTPGRKWTTVSAGNYHSLGIQTDGTLWAFGANSLGQLGDGTRKDRHVPTKISNIRNWKAVSAGHSHSLALTADGKLYAWGSNSVGQVGDGTIEDKNIHTLIPAQGKATWKAISAGESHSFGIQSDGSLWGWGENIFSVLGDGTDIKRNSPVRIGTSVAWTGISTGGTFSHGWDKDGITWSWGSSPGEEDYKIPKVCDGEKVCHENQCLTQCPEEHIQKGVFCVRKQNPVTSWAKTKLIGAVKKRSPF